MKKRILSVFLAFVMVFSCVSNTAAFAEIGSQHDHEHQLLQTVSEAENNEKNASCTFAGNGTAEAPYEIGSLQALKDVASLVNFGTGNYASACYVLTADIALEGAWTPIGTAAYPFTGSFNGNGKKLTGLTDGGDEDHFGLFGYTKDAVLTGIAVEACDIEVTGFYAVGAIAGYMQGGSLSESYVMGTVNGGTSKCVGGLVGVADGAEIQNCFSTVEMTADGYVGGIAGLGCNETALECCYNIGYLSAEYGAFGSILGDSDGSLTVEACYCIDTTDSLANYLTRTEAADTESFEGFDFDGIWMPGELYPELRISPCTMDEAWASDTTTYVTGYVDEEKHNTPAYKKTNLLRAAKGETTLSASYLLPNLPAIRNQHPYGTCWAQAIIASAETNLIKKGYADSSINLSELQFVWYHHNGTKNALGAYEDPLNNFGGDRNYFNSASYGSWGGDNYYRASKSLASWIGPINEDTVTAYSEANAQSIVNNQGLDYAYAFSKDAAHLETVKIIPANSGRTALKNALLTYGALCISYYADNRFMSSKNKYYYSSTDDDTDHAVTIVGWDDTISKDLFYDSVNKTSPSSDGAWIVRNSWGAAWGNAGYFYMSYETPYVSASGHDFFAYDYEINLDYEKCYQYDGTSGLSSKYVSGSTPSEANVYTAVGDELLSAVSFWMDNAADVSYNVKVYTDLTGSTPTSGTLAAQVSGRTDYAGYYTVALPTQVSVGNGTKFAIVLEVTNKSSIYFPLDSAYSYSYTDGSIGRFESYSKAGQSFYRGYASSSWTDVGTNNGGNFRIKAFTADDSANPRPTAPQLSVSTQGNQMKLSWNAVSNASAYNVYRSITADGTYSLLGAVSSTSYTDTTAVSGTVYYYKVAAVSATGKQSRYSASVSALIGTQTSFIVSFDPNGGSDAPECQVKTKGTDLTLTTEAATRYGYTFLGWSEDNLAGTATFLPGDSFTSDKDVTLYAVWKKGIYVSSPLALESIHNYQNASNVEWYYTDTGAKEMTLTFDSRTYFEDNYDYLYILDGKGTQIGKYCGNALAGKTVTISGDTVCIRLESDYGVTKWGFKVVGYSAQYSVSFNPNGGTGAPDTQTKIYNQTLVLSDKKPTREGYEFLGWAEEQSATVPTYQQGGNYTANASATLYAVWTEQIIAEGSCGTTLTWKLDNQGVLHINGSGAMTDYEAGNAPWQANLSQIKAVDISADTTSLGNNAFADCAELKDVYYHGGMAQWNTLVKGNGNAPLTEAEIHYLAADHTHDYATTVKEPSCTESGYTDYICKTCSDSYRVTGDAPLQHAEVIDEAVKATCQHSGLTQGTHCSRCKAVLTPQQVIPIQSHSYDIKVTAPTCTQKGYTTHTCTECHDSYVDSYVNATGHKTELRNYKAVTCDTDGYTGDQVCTVCGTTVSKGSKELALGHNWKNGTCTHCGEKTTQSAIGQFFSNITTSISRSIKSLFSKLFK